MLDPFVQDVPHRDFYKLDKIREAAKKLDNPQLGRPTILVAGTNGKGSVAAYLSRWLAELGFKTGTYFSPHVLDESERVQINLSALPQAEIKKIETSVEEVLKPLTYFERWTMLSFLVFQKYNVDFQVLEVGIGGRLDATNISEPEVSIISSIGLDHEDVLGEGYEAIAFEKSGVMRSSKLCIIPSPLPELAMKEVETQAKIKGARLLPTNTSGFDSLGNEAGEHQSLNASLAYQALNELARLHAFEPLSVEEAEKLALKTRLPARIQLLSEDPLWILDGGHNEEAVLALKRYLERHHSGRKFDIIFGLMKDKDLGVFKHLQNWAREIYYPEFYPERQYRPDEIGEKWGGKVCQDLPQLLREKWQKKDSLLVCGSFYLAGEVLKHWKELKNGR